MLEVYARCRDVTLTQDSPSERACFVLNRSHGPDDHLASCRLLHQRSLPRFSGRAFEVEEQAMA